MKWTFSRNVILGPPPPQSGNSVFCDVFLSFLSIFGHFCKKFRKIYTVFRLGNTKKPPKIPENPRKCPAGKISGKFREICTFFVKKFSRFLTNSMLRSKNKKITLFFREKKVRKKSEFFWKTEKNSLKIIIFLHFFPPKFPEIYPPDFGGSNRMIHARTASF